MSKTFRYIISVVCIFALTLTGVKAANESPQQDEIDVRNLVFSHIRDSYEWHLTNFDDKKIAIPLPVILYTGERGINIFLSDKLFPEGRRYNGFFISKEGKNEGKIVTTNEKGEEIKPFDISITKNVLGLLINSALVIFCILFTARWYKKKTPKSKSPKGFVGFLEMFIIWVEDDVIKECVGEDYMRYSPYLLTVFFFIFVNNLMGLIPIFPGGANITGNIAITLILALFTFLAINIGGNKEYWKEILWPNVPLWLKFPVPIMPLIEIFGIFSKPFALMIRLFANIMAGHSVIIALTSIIFVTVSMGTALNGTMTVVSVIFCVFMNLVELLVAFIQAYVFTMLSAVFIGLSRVKE